MASLSPTDAFYRLMAGGDSDRNDILEVLLELGVDLLAAFEDQASVIDQTTARTERNRWLAYIRDAGSAAPSQSTFRFVGGDLCDGIKRAAGDVLWIVGDNYSNTNANTAVDANDKFLVAPLSLHQRNALLVEAGPGGTFTSQVYASGSEGVWLNADTQGGYTSKVWWPLSIIQDPSNVTHVAVWLYDPFTPTIQGTLLDSHIITLNALGGFGSVTPTNFGSQTDRFWIQCMRKDATHTYILGGEFVPPLTTPIGSTVNSYAFGDRAELRTQYMLSRLARVPNAQLTTIANWQFWNGSSWVSGVTNATPVLDTNGNPVKGSAGISKTPAGHWLMVACPVADTHVNVYSSDAPQGPWKPIARVPVPMAGKVISGGSTAVWNPKVIEHLAAPAEHSIVSFSAVSLGLTIPNSVGQNIRRWAPQFIAVPWY